MATQTRERPEATALLAPLRGSWAVLLKTRKRNGSWAARRKLLDRYPLVHRFLVPLELRLKRTREVRYELDGFAPLD